MTGYRHNWRSYNDARKFIHKLKLKSRPEWQIYAHSGKKPDDIPCNPWYVYKGKGWKKIGGMSDWLGTGVLAPKDMVFWEFKKARRFVRKLKLKSRTEWEKYCKTSKLPKQVPKAPGEHYKKEWSELPMGKRWGDWLGTGSIQDNLRKYRSYKDARTFAHKLKLTGTGDWRKYCKTGKKPDDIPSNVNNTYTKLGTWISWGDFFGTGTKSVKEISKNFLPIKEAKIEARKIAKELGIKTRKAWIKAHREGKIPKNLPVDLYTYQERRSQK